MDGRLFPQEYSGNTIFVEKLRGGEKSRKYLNGPVVLRRTGAEAAAITERFSGPRLRICLKCQLSAILRRCVLRNPRSPGNAAGPAEPSAVHRLRMKTPTDSNVFERKQHPVVMIRLARVGARKQPFYRIVVIEKDRSRNGRSIEVVGTYNPRTSPATVDLKHERVAYWRSVGAQLSPTVAKLVAKTPASAPAPAPVPTAGETTETAAA
jgi:small subunit ribosomal protein S16